MNPVTGTGCTSVDIGVNAMQIVDKFCYLGDMLNVDGYADADVETRTRIVWNKFRQLVPLIMRGRLYSSCGQSSMLHAAQKKGK